MDSGSDSHVLVTTHQPLLGTVVEFRIESTDRDVATAADIRMVAEFERLEEVFSAFDESSELCRWRRGDLVGTSREFDELLAIALHWQAVGLGAYNPLVGELSTIWASAAASGQVPEPDDLEARARAITRPRYEVGPEGAKLFGDCRSINFNAIAKGYIVDRAMAAARGDGSIHSIDAITINAGGDLLHRGVGAVRVGIENPATPYDNAQPLTVVSVGNRALATSGSARRGVHVGQHWFSHVLDPRTGQPVDTIRSASVLAPDAVTADAVATIASVLEPSASISFTRDLQSVECCVVDASGRIWRSDGWPSNDADRPTQRNAM